MGNVVIFCVVCVGSMDTAAGPFRGIGHFAGLSCVLRLLACLGFMLVWLRKGEGP